jgi:hypothetical protein
MDLILMNGQKNIGLNRKVIQCLRQEELDLNDLKLNWITQCIYGGRFHMKRLFERASTLKSAWHRTNVTRDMKLDIMWWLRFINIFNGVMPD